MAHRKRLLRRRFAGWAWLLCFWNGLLQHNHRYCASHPQPTRAPVPGIRGLPRQRSILRDAAAGKIMLGVAPASSEAALAKLRSSLCTKVASPTNQLATVNVIPQLHLLSLVILPFIPDGISLTCSLEPWQFPFTGALRRMGKPLLTPEPANASQTTPNRDGAVFLSRGYVPKYQRRLELPLAAC